MPKGFFFEALRHVGGQGGAVHGMQWQHPPTQNQAAGFVGLCLFPCLLVSPPPCNGTEGEGFYGLGGYM